VILATAAIEELLFDISEALLVPVLILTVAALAMVLVELGSLLVEVRRRRHRSLWALERAVEECRDRLAAGQGQQALAALLPFAWNEKMEDAFAGVVEQYGHPQAEARIAKRLAEYDYLSLRRLERTRILVRMGPALGLMGTLIPLSPALAGLADGDVATLTDNLRVAFSVTVAGLMIGAFAFGISLIRDRLYAQDYSDVEYVAVSLTAPSDNGVTAAPHSHWAVAP
jgi:biopolymer transport protein ExbB/TolQ